MKLSASRVGPTFLPHAQLLVLSPFQRHGILDGKLYNWPPRVTCTGHAITACTIGLAVVLSCPSMPSSMQRSAAGLPRTKGGVSILAATSNKTMRLTGISIPVTLLLGMRLRLCAQHCINR